MLVKDIQHVSKNFQEINSIKSDSIEPLLNKRSFILYDMYKITQ